MWDLHNWIESKGARNIALAFLLADIAGMSAVYLYTRPLPQEFVLESAAPAIAVASQDTDLAVADLVVSKPIARREDIPIDGNFASDAMASTQQLNFADPEPVLTVKSMVSEQAPIMLKRQSRAFRVAFSSMPSPKSIGAVAPLAESQPETSYAAGSSAMEANESFGGAPDSSAALSSSADIPHELASSSGTGVDPNGFAPAEDVLERLAEEANVLAQPEQSLLAAEEPMLVEPGAQDELPATPSAP